MSDRVESVTVFPSTSPPHALVRVEAVGDFSPHAARMLAQRLTDAAALSEADRARRAWAAPAVAFAVPVGRDGLREVTS